MSNYTGKINVLIGGEASAFYNAIGGVQKKLNGFAKNLDQISKNISTKVSLPLTILGGIATNVTATFSDSMLKVKALTSATDSEFSKLSDTAKTLGINTKFSASQVGDAMTYMGLAGWSTQQILSGVDGVLSLAAASGEDLARVSDILTDGLSAFGKEAGYSGRMADILAQASAKSNTTVGLLGEAFKYVAPLAGALKFEVEDVGLALGIMANAGIKGSQAGTALRATLSRLVKPTKESEQAMNALNFTAINADGSIKPLAQIIEELREKFKNLAPAEQAANAGMLAGQEAMSGFLALINASDSDFENLQTNLLNSEGAAMKMAETMEGGLGGAIRRMRSSIEGILITIGEQLTPYIEKASAWVNAFSNAFNNLNPFVLKIGVALGVVLAVIPPLIVAFGQIIGIVTSSMKSIQTLLPLLGGISAPVLAIAAAVGAAVALIIYYWDDIKAYFTSGEGTVFLDSLKELWNTVMDSIMGEVKKLVTVTKELWAKYGKDIIEVFNSLLNVVGTQIGNIVKVISLGIRFITTNIQVFLKLIQGDFKGAFGVIKDFVVDVFKTIGTVVINSFKSVLGVAQTIADKLGFDTISNGIDNAIQRLDLFNSKLEKTKKVNDSIVDQTFTPLETKELPATNTTTEEGTTPNGGGLNRAVSMIKFVKKEFDITSSFAGSKIDELTNKGIQLKERWKAIAIDLSEGFNQIINDGLANGLESFGDALGNVLAGSENVSSLGISILSTLADTMSQLGKMAIGAGIAILGIKTALESLNPIAAIAGGIALVALSAAVKSGLSNMSSNYGGARAEGGKVDVGSAYLVGERGRELFVPNQSGNIISSNDLAFGGSNQSVILDGKFRIEGSDLVYLVNKENNRRGRI
ncbi:TP901 family phage tail tape measure protein [Algoriphagus sp. 4150]|uniref:phage tail tape measure protein n=1 Tax=Algoriphagus sp. 4150 TaxID=2817756 RepID=UPI002862BCC0|nr:phage tail tape measure protein [Algoriphagus sp. 4150]MDR7130685.1 TP901 family phage tail tape measure protein [Algoriphagus sp. 4150]